MLMQLAIQHYVIINKLELVFEKGMTAITGETGAGKSIIIDALELAVGKRADQRVIAVDKPQCEISALFNIAHIHGAKGWLSENGLTDADEENTCLLRRIIHRDNPSRAYINGHMVTLSQLRDLGELLIHIHGQHEHQQLLKSQQQSHLVDTFGQHKSLCETVKQHYQCWLETREALDKVLAKAGGNTEEKKAFLQYQIEELQALNLKEGDTAQLEKTLKQLAKQAHVLQTTEETLLALDERDEKPIVSELVRLQQGLNQYADLYPELNTIAQLLEQAHIHTQEAVETLQGFREHQLHDPNEEQQTESRLSAIYDLARKHRVAAETLHTVLPALEAELASLEGIDKTIVDLEQRLENLAKTYYAEAHRLSLARRKAADQLNRAITDYMQTLSMQGGQFCAVLSPYKESTPRANGLDVCEFQVSTNPGQPLQPLNKVASGGELSRLSLAIQLITAQQEEAATMLFDEVDVGIGGSTAAKVGHLLQQLGSRTQVICITHLPQVAAMATTQWSVRKEKKASHTQSRIHHLSPEERIEEIARMLGGLSITAQTRAHAEDMLNQALRLAAEQHAEQTP
ncbi:MAG: recN [Gammaproteobacteria bacterium]|jgi:DNA repair protein RecN (Recombination protein N)|nr:recN [Gammaproteobacteria bacterium]